MNKEILRLAIPSILANITVPIVGIVDVAIAGHLSDASAIGGIAIGGMLFDLLYWNFGFLRVGTGGMTAQAYGRKDDRSSVDILTQNLSIALAGALLVFAVGWLFVDVVMWFVPCSSEVESFARDYFRVRIWAAPATLSLMVFKGWFIGRQDTVVPMICDVTVNVVNMLASYLLAVHTSLGVVGVAHGTVIAQYSGLLVAVVLLYRGHRCLFPYFDFRSSVGWTKIRRLVALNGNLFLRSLGFMVVYVGFTAFTSSYGDGPLAVGAIMMKLFMLFSYFVDGFAYAGEALVGRFIGARDPRLARVAIRHLFVWALGVGLVFTFVYLFGGEGMFRLMTSDEGVVGQAEPFLFWLVLMPVISCAAFMWDGVFVGATAGRQVRDCMLFAAVGFLLGAVLLAPFMGVQAVYVGYFVHLLVRTLYLSARWKKVMARAFACLALMVVGVSASAQHVEYVPADSAQWTEIERLMAEERVRQMQGVIADYEEKTDRREREFHTEGVNLLLRGVLSGDRDRRFRSGLSRPLVAHDADVFDYGIAFSPLVAAWGMKLMGVESRSKTSRMVVSNVLGLGLTYGVTKSVKSWVDESRPNGSDMKSMPSGHTAMAFASATILHREYGHLSPWVSVGGYGAATATQFLRLRRNEHWMTDLYVGAGIGTVATNLAYFVSDKVFGADGYRRRRLTMADVNRTLMYVSCPTSFALTSGVELGHDEKVGTSTAFSVGLEYSHFFNADWAVEAMGRLATCHADYQGMTGNLDFFHLDGGVRYSRSLAAPVRLSLRAYAGGRYVDSGLLPLRRELRPELGMGLHVDFMNRESYAFAVGCDYNYVFSDWFRGRWVLNMQWRVLL